MISNSWLDKRSGHWTRLGKLIARTQWSGVASLSHLELRELAFLYRQLAADLSALRQDPTARNKTDELNGLLARAHSIVYSQKRSGWRMVRDFLWCGYPRLFRQLLPYVLASLILFLAGAILGALMTIVRPDFMRMLLGPQMVHTIEQGKMWTESVTSMSPQASSSITTNNIGVTFAAFAGGILGGLGTLYLIGFNGVLLGVVGAACQQHHMSLSLWSFVAPHGSLELPAIIIAGAAGMRLGYGLLFPGMYTRRYSITHAGAEAVRLLAGTIPMLIVAGTLEGFFSPSHAPAALKFVVAAVLFSLLVAWLTHSAPEKKAPATAAADEYATATAWHALSLPGSD